MERVSKMPYEKYIEENILRPLKMKRSTFLRKAFEKDADIMTAYLTQQQEGEIKVTPSRHPFHKFIYAPGGLLNSAMELTHYLAANINGGVFEGRRILDASLMGEMHRTQFETDYFRFYIGQYGKMGYDYGWMIAEDFLGHKLVSHGGSTGVSSAHLMFVPDLKIGLATAANVGKGPLPAMMGALVFLMGRDPEKEIPDFEMEKKLSMLAGEYAIYKGITTVSVVKKGPILYVESKQRGTETSYPLIPETDNIEDLKFYAIYGPGKRMPVEFVVDPSGKVDRYIERNRFHKVGGHFVALK